MKRIFYFAIMSSYSCSENSSITYSYNKDRDLIFFSTEKNKKIDSVFFEGNAEILYEKDFNDLKYLSIKTRCGSGCTNNELVVLGLKNKKLHKSLQIDFLGRNYNEEIIFKYNEFKDEYIVLEELSIIDLDTVKTKYKLFYDKKLNIYYSDYSNINWKVVDYFDAKKVFDVKDKKIPVVFLNKDTLVYYNSKWYYKL